MSIPSIESCCSSYLLDDIINCPNENIDKDVYPPSFYDAPAITGFILSFFYFGVVLLIIKNIVRHSRKREDPSFLEYLFINILFFATVTGKFVYLLDGPIQLFGQGSGIPILAYLSLRTTAEYSLHATFTYSSYSWLKMILIYKHLWEKRGVPHITKAFIFFDLIYILGASIFTLVVIITDYSSWSQVIYLLLAISTLTSCAVLIISCYTMATYLSKIYAIDLTQKKKVRTIKGFAIAIGVCMIGHAVRELSYVSFDWEESLKFYSYCNQNIDWSVYLFIINILTNILPYVFFAFIFAGQKKKKLDHTPSDVSRELFGPDDLTHDLDGSGPSEQEAKKRNDTL